MAARFLTWKIFPFHSLVKKRLLISCYSKINVIRIFPHLLISIAGGLISPFSLNFSTLVIFFINRAYE